MSTLCFTRILTRTLALLLPACLAAFNGPAFSGLSTGRVWKDLTYNLISIQAYATEPQSAFLGGKRPDIAMGNFLIEALKHIRIHPY